MTKQSLAAAWLFGFPMLLGIPVIAGATDEEEPAGPNVPAHRFDAQAFAAKALDRPVGEVHKLWNTPEGAIQLLRGFTNEDSGALDSLSGPVAVVRRELSLVVAGDRFDLGKNVPVDYVVWRKTPHKEPWRTKLGGVPWRPRNRPWPFCSTGHRHTFVVQFDISDSLDVLPKRFLDKRPKGHDLLLIFMSNEEAWADNDEAIYMEWSSRKIANPCRADDFPKPRFTVPPRAGLLFRGNEYPEEREYGLENDERYAIPEVQEWYSATHSTHLGSAASWIQGDERDSGTELFLTLGSFSPPAKWPYPDAEVLEKDPKQYSTVFGRDNFMFGDDGAGYFTVSAGGKISHYFTCY